MAEAIKETNIHMTQQIATGEHNMVFHNEWDKTNVIGSNVVDRY